MDQRLKELNAQLKNTTAVIDKELMQQFIKEEAVSYLRKTKEFLGFEDIVPEIPHQRVNRVKATLDTLNPF